MYLSAFGLITIDGSVTKLEPNQNFERYQLLMSHYGTTLALKSRVDAQQKKYGEQQALKTLNPPAKAEEI